MFKIQRKPGSRKSITARLEYFIHICSRTSNTNQVSVRVQVESIFRDLIPDQKELGQSIRRKAS